MKTRLDEQAKRSAELRKRVDEADQLGEMDRQ